MQCNSYAEHVFIKIATIIGHYEKWANRMPAIVSKLMLNESYVSD